MKVQAHDLSQNIKTPKYSLAQLTVEEFYKFWPQISSMMDKIPHTWKQWTKEYVVAAVETGSLVVWCIGPPPDAVFVFFTQVSVYPVGRVLIVPWGAGTFAPDMLPLLDATLTQYAQLQDCVTIEIRGRDGWEKHFAPIGFKKECVTLSRSVPNMRMQ
jgi:hypothetical protein